VTDNLAQALTDVFGKEPVMFRNDSICNMEILTDNPAEVGMDIIAGCFAVKEKYSLPAIVIDMGTATTVTAMDEKGAILGVSIITGTMRTLFALHTSTGLPVDPSLTPPAKVIGTNTADSIASGIVYGTACMIDGMIRKFEKEMGAECNVYATGGISKVILPLCEKKCEINNRLIPQAMYLYYQKMKNSFAL
jgi:type III pantothenate kinase